MNFIKHWRKTKGLTLQALGEALEPAASAGTVQSYEAGSRDPSLSRLIEIARVLGVSPGKLLDGPPLIPSQAELAGMLASAQGELPVGVSIADYPTAVASSLRDQLLQFSGVASSGLAETGLPGKDHAEAAPPRRPTKRSVAA